MMNVLIVLLTVIALTLLVLQLVPWIRKNRYAKTASTPNSIQIDVVPHPFDQNPSGDQSIQSTVVEAIHFMSGPSQSDAEKYSEALVELRSHSAEAVSAIYSEYQAHTPKNYLLRWSLVRLLKQMRAPSSLDVLDEIVRAAIPPDTSIDKDEYIEDLMIKTMAVSAACEIARSGDDEAMSMLFRQLEHEELSVKRAVIFACFDLRGESVRSDLQNRLPKEYHSLLDRVRPHPSRVANIEIPFDKKAYEDVSIAADIPGQKPAPHSNTTIGEE